MKKQKFNNIYKAAIEQVGQVYKSDSARVPRFYRLAKIYEKTLDLDGFTAECGCFRGLSSRILCETAKFHNSDYLGENFYLIDSFQGFNYQSSQDGLDKQEFLRLQKKLACSLHTVKQHLNDFPKLTYFDGWIPEVLNRIPQQQKYRFIHVDVDLYEPTKACFEYFYPKLVKDGVIVCDDYYAHKFAGAKKAIDEFCTENQLTFKYKKLDLSLILYKK